MQTIYVIYQRHFDSLTMHSAWPTTQRAENHKFMLEKSFTGLTFEIHERQISE